MTMPGPAAIGLATGTGAGTLQRSTKAGAVTPSYGMTMWFNVSVSGLDGVRSEISLGTWSACSGLDVKLTPEGPFEEGGNYLEPHFLPGKISYGQVTLERAMTAAGTAKVRQWLESQAKDWVRGASRAELAQATVVIELFSGLGKGDRLIHRWELKDAIPVSWTVPPFSTSGSGGIAIEKLALVHSGFLKAVEPVPGHRLELIEKADDTSRLSFEFNPAKITLNRAREAETGRGKVDTTTVVVDPNALAITLTDLHLEGHQQISAGVERLRRWIELHPDSWRAARPTGAPAAAEPGNRPECETCGRLKPSPEKASAAGSPVVLKMVWGVGGGGLPKEMLLKSFELNFRRFTATGQPSRATVKLTLQEYKGESRTGSTPPQASPRSGSPAASTGPRIGSARVPAGRQP